MRLDTIRQAVETHKDQIRDPYRTLFELLGFDGIIEICQAFGGTTVYIPQVKGIFKDCIRQQILSEFSCDNYKTLSSKYGLTERTVRNIIEDKE